MAEDPEKAIERLEQYRAESKTKNLDLPSEGDYEESPVRQFFVKMYYFNAVVIGGLAFAFFIGGWSLENINNIFVFLLGVVAFVLFRQTLITIDRMVQSEGRNTTVDDVFIVFLIAGMFFFYSLFLPLEGSVFRPLHIALAVLWLIQIYFVNFQKPDVGTLKKSKGGIIEGDGSTLSAVEQVMDFFTGERLIIVGLSIVIGLILSFV